MKLKILFIAALICFVVQSASAALDVFNILNPANARATNDITCTLPALSTNVWIQSGATNRSGAPGTSTNLTINLAGHDNCGLTVKFTGNAALTNAAVGVLVYKSSNLGVIYNTNAPDYSITNIPAAPGSTTFIAVTNLSCQGMTDLAFQIINNTSGTATNFVMQLTPK